MILKKSIFQEAEVFPELIGSVEQFSEEAGGFLKLLFRALELSTFFHVHVSLVDIKKIIHNTLHYTKPVSLLFFGLGLWECRDWSIHLSLLTGSGM